MPQPEAILYFSYDGPLYDTLFKCEEFVSHLGDPGMHIGTKGRVVRCDFEGLTTRHGLYRLTDAYNWHGTVESQTIKLSIYHSLALNF